MGFRTLIALSVVVASGLMVRGDDSANHAFFEERIRPLLVEHCHECHGAKKQEGGLRLDAAITLRRGGESGQIVPSGDEITDDSVNESRLIQAVEYNGDIKMPPAGKLTDQQIADLRTWVRNGSPWPAERLPEDLERAQRWREHWAFRPVVSPRVPGFSDAVWARGMAARQSEIKKAKSPGNKSTASPPKAPPLKTSVPMGLDGPSSNGFVKTPIDAFILAKLNEQGLKPSPSANRASLLRRIKFDLVGLPPTKDEVEAFERDASPDAVRNLVDRYLALPQYGERWGRHWLDLVRYADSNGRDGESEGQMPFAYSYRDWVVRAFNEDKPYNQFLVDQIAADLLDNQDDDNRDLAALGFLSLARARDQDEVMLVADRLDLLGRTTMGLALACARCHDHKYDPIPTRDYYSLYGVFVEMRTAEVPLLANAADQRRLERFNNRIGELRGPLENFVDVRRRRWIVDFEKRLADYFHATRPEAAGVIPVGRDAGQLHPQLFERVKTMLDESSEPFDAVFGPWRELRDLSPEDFKAQIAERSQTYAALKPPPKEDEDDNESNEGESQENESDEAERFLVPRVAQLFQSPPGSLDELLDRYIALFQEAVTQSIPGRERQWNEGVDPSPLEDVSLETLRKQLYDEEGPMDLTVDQLIKDFRDYFADDEQQAIEAFLGRINDFKRSRLAAAHAMVVQDPPEPVTPAVFKKGNPDDRGDEVPRQFLEFLSPADRQPFENGTGRLELARAIADAKNPLTARVIVNRVWMHHMGRGLVETPSDFGMISQPPSHPELLDWLADWFVRSGWSLKKLHRLILVSNVYQQTSAARADAMAKDPENRWLWRANRRRLDFEATHDAMAAVADQLDLSIGGPSEPLFEETDDLAKKRRALYGAISRGSTTTVPMAFDFPNPTLSSARRDESLVPQQSLFFLNSHFVASMSRSLARQATDAKTPRDRIVKLYAAIFARQPSDEELTACEEFLSTADQTKDDSADTLQQTWHYGYGDWNAGSKRLDRFVPFPRHHDGNWQIGIRVPHGKFGYLFLNGEGGHPSPDPNMLVIRRWIAPEDGVVDLEGKLRHESEGTVEENPDIDGVRARILVRGAMIGSWTNLREEKETNVPRIKVKAGDAIDFAVDCRKTDSNDYFRWGVTVTWKSAVNAPESSWRQWNSGEDYSGPLVDAGEPLSPLARLAQTLLMSNEFVFVD